MQIIKAIQDSRVNDRLGQLAYTLLAGESYVLHDEEAGLGLRGNAIQWVESLDRKLPQYGGQHLSHERLLLSFIGRAGDALVTASCLATLIELYPHVTIDIACRPEAQNIFTLTPQIANVISYPLSAHVIERYNYYMCFEGIESISHGSLRSCQTVFSACLHTPHPHKPATIVIPQSFQDLWSLPDFECETIGLAIGQQDSLRSYPLPACSELANQLMNAGYMVFLLGGNEPDRNCMRENFPQAKYIEQAEALGDIAPTATIIDLVGRTPTPADLAAIMAQLDVMVTSDSFPMHLSGALSKPTVTVFTTTHSALASAYPTVHAVSSQLACSPCGQAQGPCPLGHGYCIAHDDDAVSPQAMMAYIQKAKKDSQLTVALARR